MFVYGVCVCVCVCVCVFYEYPQMCTCSLSFMLTSYIIIHVLLLLSVTSLANARHHLSTLVATDLRETLHDTIIDAMRGELNIAV